MTKEDEPSAVNTPPDSNRITSPTLYGEPADLYRRRLEELKTDLQPRTAVEKVLVDYIAVCSWRIGRMVNLEWAVVNFEMPAPDPDNPQDWADSTAIAYRSLVEKSRCLDFIGRSEKRAFSALENALNLFLTVRKEFPAKQGTER